MKLSTLIIIALLGILAWKINTTRMHPAQSAALPAPAMPALAEVKPAPPEHLGRPKRYMIDVLQHMEDGALLVKCYGTHMRYESGPIGTYVLTGFPIAGEIPDGTDMEVYACEAGVTSYTTTAGARRTLTRLMYSPEETPAPAAAPAPVVMAKPTPVPDPAADRLRRIREAEAKYGTR